MGIVDDVAGQWSVGAVARRLGLAPATLRTWDRRYGLGPGGHRPGAHRRYDESDLRRLERMAALLRQGMPTAAAAALVTAEGPSTGPAGWGAGVAAPVRADPDGNPGTNADTDTDTDTDADTKRRRRGLTRASIALDPLSATRQALAALAALGVLTAWEQVLYPVLVEAGLRWEVTGTGVDIEHLLSNSITESLHTRSAQSPPPHPLRPVLLACAADEQHQLPVRLLATLCQEARIPVRLLGAATPREALAAATRRVGPSAVVVWAQLHRTADPALLAGLPRMRPAVAVFAAGTGWRDVPLPDGVQRLESARGALAALADAAGLGGRSG